MRNPWLIAVIAGLIGIITLCFTMPGVMLAPGPVRPAHAAIAGDCFACHQPLQGASASRCIACHQRDRIGLFSTKGVRLAGHRTAFHQQLAVADCMACHSDHAGPRLAGRVHPGFSHGLLRADVQQDCQACHTRPADALHRQIGSRQCSACHATSGWRPATFAHDRFFRLDGPHAVACASCHVSKSNFAAYSCYGCHEHEAVATRAMHRREGVNGNIDQCVRCHRSGEGGEGGEGREGGERGGDD